MIKRNKIICKLIASMMIFSTVTCAMPFETAFAAESTSSISSEENGLVIKDNVLVNGKKAKGDVVIPDGVTKISKDAFSHNDDITSVKIPSSVTDIEDYAFASCRGLKNANVPSSVKVIKKWAFELTGLVDIEIEDGVEEIDKDAFAYCYKLKSINIPSSVKKIGSGAFYRCHELEDIKYNEDAVIERDAFAYTKFTADNGKFDIQNNVLVNADSDIEGVVNIPDEVTEIGEKAFANNTYITKVVVGKNVKKIGKEAFFRCDSLTEVVLPDSLETIGDSAFSPCFSLKTINIPEGVKTISREAFEGDKSLSEISIPDSVKTIGEYAFKGCDKLEKVYMNTEGKVIEDDAFPVGVTIVSNNNTTTTNNNNSNNSSTTTTNNNTTNNNSTTQNSIPSLNKGWNKVEGRWYYVDSNGKMLKSQWYYNGHDWYYLSKDGSMYCDCMATIDGVKYSFNYPNGEMRTGWVQDARHQWYYFNPVSDGTKGSMVKSKWVYYYGKWYYLDENGVMAVNTITPDGYRVDSTGAWIR